MASKETPLKTITIVAALCLVCSIVVSGAAVGLRDAQNANKALDKQTNLLSVAGKLEENANVGEIYAKFVEAKFVDLNTGEYVEENAATFDQLQNVKDLTKSTDLTGKDVAGIKRRSNVADVYLVKDAQGNVESYVLPVYGRGLWSTMYAFVAIDKDGKTVKRIQYYDQGETPGLGGEVLNPLWTAKWEGKQLFNANGDVAIRVVKGGGQDKTPSGIDGLSGATLTGQGVENTFQFWIGENGFGPFLKKLQNGGSNNG
ncbi:Na(+)-translocating NADH-quinone reductase subunit C [Moritella sp. 24]|uniref:Na(+)-translocating NADH-quinone reductase subunit C n=1 Tax=Moritella sp. 24 TaxID=2746230 RepID=UPI001BA76AB5|nr:Na(+)-translocating NADH-quinone reductase subunit C [Moritella sp. 24]QUM75336.1 Na(+)-translocating NADH-quinone reductase subunit C [Moritella sp. 24]